MSIGTVGVHKPESIAVVGEDDPFSAGGKFGGIK